MKNVKVNITKQLTYGEIMDVRAGLILLGKVKGCTFTWDISTNLTILTEKAKKIEDFMKQLTDMHTYQDEAGKTKYHNIKAYQDDMKKLDLKKITVIMHRFPDTMVDKIKEYCEEGLLEANVVSSLDGVFFDRKITGLGEDIDFSEFDAIKKNKDIPKK